MLALNHSVLYKPTAVAESKYEDLRTGVVHFPGLSEDSRSRVLNQPRLSNHLFREAGKHSITIVHAEDKHTDFCTNKSR